MQASNVVNLDEFKIIVKQAKKVERDEKKSELEDLFESGILRCGLPEPEKRITWAKCVGRDFHSEFGYTDLGILFEIEGGSESHGTYYTTTDESGKKVRKQRYSRHLTPSGFAEDCRKYNLANALGFRVYRFTGAQVRSGQAMLDAATIYAIHLQRAKLPAPLQGQLRNLTLVTRLAKRDDV